MTHSELRDVIWTIRENLGTDAAGTMAAALISRQEHVERERAEFRLANRMRTLRDQIADDATYRDQLELSDLFPSRNGCHA